MRASLFITCLMDVFYPHCGESTVRVLQRLGVEVDFPPGQTCCGQPAWNSGFRAEAESVAAQLIHAFAESEQVVTPSGSCAAMIRHYYPSLFSGRPALQAKARALAAKTYEFSEFLVKVLGVTDVGARLEGRATYHTSCHMTRGLRVVDPPHTLLRHVAGLELVDLPDAEDCCGFGGTFAVKMPDISEAIADSKLQRLAETGADILVGADMGCLMHLGGRLSRLGRPVRVMHLAEVLDSGVESP